jgi:predicted outer membrane protein
MRGNENKTTPVVGILFLVLVVLEIVYASLLICAGASEQRKADVLITSMYSRIEHPLTISSDEIEEARQHAKFAGTSDANKRHLEEIAEAHKKATNLYYRYCAAEDGPESVRYIEGTYFVKDKVF